ncbi:MAG: AAA family ATPase [Anaerolineae bacterium]|nr:AAA family ATPase [Anaerolineae bacterium]
MLPPRDGVALPVLSLEKLTMLDVQLLGKFEIRRDGQVIEIPLRPAQSLLAYLLLNADKSVRREKLAGLLWPDSDEAGARNNLRQTLWRLRSVIGDDYFVTDRVAVGVNAQADYQLDADTLQQVVDATTTADQLISVVSVYEDRLLPGFYDEWVLLEQERLQAIFEDRMQRLLDRLVEAGRWREAREWAEWWIARGQQPEPAYRALMLAQAGLGDRAGVAAAYQRCVAVLDEEFGVEPSAETHALYQQLINEAKIGAEKIEPNRQRPPTDPPQQDEHFAQSPAFMNEADESMTAGEIFIGRERELDRLDQLLVQSTAGRGQAAFVIGEAGQGKTSLLKAFARQAQAAHPSLIVAGGTCDVYTGIGDPYVPFRQVFSMLTGNIETQWAAGTITRDHALRLWHLLPHTVQALVDDGPDLIDTFVPGEALAGRAATYAPNGAGWLSRLQEILAGRTSPGGEPSADQRRIFEQVSDVLRILANRQPLLLILDDLHWADLSSISLLSHLALGLADIPMMLIGAYRPEDTAQGRDGERHPLTDILSELKRHFGDIWLDLEHHEPRVGRTFVDALLDSEPNQLDETFRQQLLRHTDGHPLFTVELLRDMQERGDVQRDDQGRWIEASDLTWDALPARVEGVIEKRIGRLSAELREVLSVASVEGEEFTAEVIARILNIDERTLVRRLSGELNKQHRLVTPQGLRRVEPSGQRLSRYRFRHNLFRTYLYHSLDEVEQSYWHEAVGHVLEQMHAPQIETVAVQLARHFEQAGLAAKASDYWQQAADAAARIYANAEAIEAYRRSLALIERHKVSSQKLKPIYTGLGRALELNNQHQQALSHYQDLAKLAQHRHDLPLELTALMAQLPLYAVPGPLFDPSQGQTLGKAALTLAGNVGDRAAEAKILWNLSNACMYLNRMSQAIDYGERSLTLARELNLREQMAFTLNDLANCFWVLGRFDQAKQSAREAQVLWRELGNLPMLADSLNISAQIHVRIGEYDQALIFSAEARQISQAINNIWGESHSQFRIGYAYWERGQIEAAITVTKKSIRQSEEGGYLVPPIVSRTELAAVYGSLGQINRGLELAHQALTIAREQVPLYQPFVLGTLAQLQLANNQIAAAQEALELSGQDPSRDAWPVYYVPVRVADGRLALKLGDYERALAVADDLLADLRRFGMRSEIPETLYLQGQILLGLGQAEAAQNRWREARAEAEAIGSRRMLWPILFALSQLEPDPVAAQDLRRQAQDTIDYIADHIGDADLRASFLATPQVQAVLELQS